MKKYKIGLDYGHGGKDPGALGFGLKEKEEVLKIGKILSSKLRSHNNIEVIETRKEDKTLSLAERSNLFNSKNVDISISLHNNAFSSSKANGIETWFSTGSSKGQILASKVHQKLVEKKIFPTNRGIKNNNYFHMLIRPKAPSILIEIGFITNKTDNNIITTQKERIAQAIYEGILDYLGIDGIKPLDNEKVFYRVVTGSYTNKENAENQIRKLKKAGFNSFIDIYKK